MSADEAQVTKSQVGGDLHAEAREHSGAVSGKAAGWFKIYDLQFGLLSWQSIPPLVRQVVGGDLSAASGNLASFSTKAD